MEGKGDGKRKSGKDHGRSIPHTDCAAQRNPHSKADAISTSLPQL